MPNLRLQFSPCLSLLFQWCRENLNFLPSFKQVSLSKQTFYTPQFFWRTFPHGYLMQVAYTRESERLKTSKTSLIKLRVWSTIMRGEKLHKSSLRLFHTAGSEELNSFEFWSLEPLLRSNSVSGHLSNHFRLNCRIPVRISVTDPHIR